MASAGGFTLVELVVGMGLLAAISLLLIALFLSAQNLQAFGSGIARASNVGNCRIMTLKALSYATLEAAVGATLPPQQVQDGPTMYTVTSSISRLVSNPTDADYRVLRLLVRVSWEERRSAEVSQDKALLGRVGNEVYVESITTPEASY